MRVRPVLLATLIALAPMAVPVPASAACSTPWGSTAERAPDRSEASVTGVRAGKHTCFDRFVVDLNWHRDGYLVRYVPSVHQEGSGALVPLRGGAKLEVIVRSPAYDHFGNPTYVPRNPREVVPIRYRGYRTLRQAAYAGSFEGQTTFGVGVRARLPFRVFTLAGAHGTSMVVVDVAHTW